MKLIYFLFIWFLCSQKFEMSSSGFRRYFFKTLSLVCTSKDFADDDLIKSSWKDQIKDVTKDYIKEEAYNIPSWLCPTIISSYRAWKKWSDRPWWFLRLLRIFIIYKHLQVIAKGYFWPPMSTAVLVIQILGVLYTLVQNRMKTCSLAVKMRNAFSH